LTLRDYCNHKFESNTAITTEVCISMELFDIR